MTQADQAIQAEMIAPDDARLAQVLMLIRDSFAGMEGRIDPPSSMHGLRLDDIRAQCLTGEVWVIGTPPAACMFLTPTPDTLYLGRLAVANTHRGQGWPGTW